MKTKFRKITVNDREYLYIKRDDYVYGTYLDITIYLKGYQRTPLMVRFHTIKDSFIDLQPPHSGITLFNSKTNESILVNLNEPKYIREFILLGIKNGWTGTNNLPRQNGLQYLTEMGFEVDHLKAPPFPVFINPNDRFKDVLAEATIPQINNLLEQHATFFPIAIAILKNETITEVAIHKEKERPSPEQAIKELKQVLQTRAVNEQYLACAMFYITRTLNRTVNKTTDVIAMHYENATDGEARIYYYPYTFTLKKKIKYGKSGMIRLVAKEIFIPPVN